MKKITFYMLMVAAAVGCNNPSGSTTPTTAQNDSFTADKTIQRKVDSLLSLMTLDEKIGQLSQFVSHWDVTGPTMPADFQTYLEKGLVGSVFNAVTVPGVRQIQEVAVKKTRLGIPILFGHDVIHGYKTIFPIPLAEACSWDLDLMKKTAAIAAEEAAADGIKWTFAPMVDIARDPRWGRVMEGAGEDPYLGSRIAEARTQGFQGGSDWHALSQTNTLLACVKHFAAYGASESGRDYNTAELSQHTLWNVYLPPYQAAINAGAGSVMASFNELNGIPATANHYLLTDILRNQWHFKGFVVSDYTGINELVPHGIATDDKHAAELAFNAGIDMDMTGATFIKYLKTLLEEGKVKEEAINNAARRILEVKFALGLFDDPYKFLDDNRPNQTFMKPEFLQVARTAVAKSVVLLKNDNNLLPIVPSESKKVALIGAMIKDSINQNGEWQARGDRELSASLFKGLQEVYRDSKVQFTYAQGCTLTATTPALIAQAVATARSADKVVVALGEDFSWSGEANCLTDIRLRAPQRELLQALKQTGKPIVLLVYSGRPLNLSEESQLADAILQVWMPGTQSGYGIADVLSGNYNPSGRLVITFPRNVGQIPIYYNQKNTGRPENLNNPYADYRSNYLDAPTTPLYPFGYGLSYTSFSITNLKLSSPTLTQQGSLTATAQVSNIGNRDGEIVVQLYIRDKVATVTRPVKELKGFQKIALKAGETKQVEFTITPELLSFYNANLQKVAEPGSFTLWIAQHSADNTNEQTFELK